MEGLQKSGGWFFAGEVILIILGIYAILVTIIPGLAVVIMIGALFCQHVRSGRTLRFLGFVSLFRIHGLRVGWSEGE
jgi:hypothetical protein